jgi:hypothetical protein
MMGGNGSKSACYMNFFVMDVMPNCSTCCYLDGQHHTCVTELLRPHGTILDLCY